MGLCANVPISFACPALARCGGQIPFPIPVNPLPPIPVNPLPPQIGCVCNGMGVPVGNSFVESGHCNFQDINDPLRRYFCYVDPSPTCTDCNDHKQDLGGLRRMHPATPVLPLPVEVAEKEKKATEMKLKSKMIQKIVQTQM